MNNSNDNEKAKNKEKPEKNPKFYVALLVCLTAISVAGWSTYKTVKNFIVPQKTASSSPRISRAKENPTSKEVDKTNILDTEHPENTSKNNKPIPYEKKSASAAPANPTNVNPENEKVQAVWSEKTEPLSIAYPCTSTVTKEFSEGTPVYSKTLGDWRCHEGTDFKAEKGSKVSAITSGVVTDIYEDSLYGTTVVISHDAQFTAYYSGLNENVPVKKGSKVKGGEEIGSIEKVPCELLEESHLHLSINKDGKFIDPLLILDKEV